MCRFAREYELDEGVNFSFDPEIVSQRFLPPSLSDPTWIRRGVPWPRHFAVGAGFVG